MTERDKAAIEGMRRSGLSYQEIAGNLAISKDAVRSYCRTHDTRLPSKYYENSDAPS